MLKIMRNEPNAKLKTKIDMVHIIVTFNEQKMALLRNSGKKKPLNEGLQAGDTVICLS